MVWARRHKVRGEESSNDVAPVRCEGHDKLFVPGYGYRKVQKFVDPPVLCFSCSRWNHKAWQYEHSAFCLFCAGSHHSTVCSDNEIREGVSMKRGLDLMWKWKRRRLHMFKLHHPRFISGRLEAGRVW